MFLRLPRGMRDVEPEEYRKIRYIYEKFAETVETYGFSLMEPSSIEFFDTVSRKSGPQIREEIYTFRDKSGRELALRFDLTVGLTRYVLSKPQLPLPIKLAAFSVMWRYDEPQFARYRSFYQWDAEIFGADQRVAGGEIIGFSQDFLRRLGIKDAEVKVSSRALMNKLIEKYIPRADSIKIMRIIDKRDRIGLEKVRGLISEEAGDKEGASRLIEVISKPYDTSSIHDVLSEIDPEIVNLKCFRDLVDTVYLAESSGAKNIVIDLSVVRGLDYYDAVVFEVASRRAPEVGALVGGGSFTPLVTAFGGKIAAFGAAGGIERTIMVIDKLGIPYARIERKKLFIAYTKPDLIGYALKLAQTLRENEVLCEIDLSGRKLDRQLKYAEKMGFKYVAIIGEREVKHETVSLKNFETAEQIEVSLNELITRFS